jgi:hypothetical protein
LHVAGVISATKIAGPPAPSRPARTSEIEQDFVQINAAHEQQSASRKWKRANEISPHGSKVLCGVAKSVPRVRSRKACHGYGIDATGGLAVHTARCDS